MTAQSCTGSAGPLDSDEPRIYQGRRPSYERPTYTPGDEAAVIARDEHRYEQHANGDDYRDWYGDRTAFPPIDPAEEAAVIRELRESARRILGRTA